MASKYRKLKKGKWNCTIHFSFFLAVFFSRRNSISAVALLKWLFQLLMSLNLELRFFLRSLCRLCRSSWFRCRQRVALHESGSVLIAKTIRNDELNVNIKYEWWKWPNTTHNYVANRENMEFVIGITYHYVRMMGPTVEIHAINHYFFFCTSNSAEFRFGFFATEMSKNEAFGCGYIFHV